LRIYNDVQQSVDLEDPVLFNHNGIIVGNLAHVLNSGYILIGEVGYYEIQGKLFHEYAIQVALFLNGVLLPGSVMGEPATNAMGIIHYILKIMPGDLSPDINSPSGVAAILELRNHTSYITPITLNGREGSGSDTTQSNASMMVIQLQNYI
jgi:hypothetical protein